MVRAAAALTHALAGSSHGTRALLEALSMPSAGLSCKRDYPYFGPIFMSRLLPAAIERAPLEDLVPALDLLLSHAPAVIYHGGWGMRLRAKAFPDGYPRSAPLTVAQQALRNMVTERCFGPESPPLRSSGDARETLLDIAR